MAERWTDKMLDTLAGVAARNSGDISDLRGVVENFTLQLNVFVEEGRAFRSDEHNAI